MSRKRSDAAIQAYHERFVAGACELHGVDEAMAERVFEMVQGFSGFGFPKAHGAAFGLLAYQSTWLRVHSGPEFLCSLLNEQPMGFYPPDTLIHEAQRRGIEVIAPDVNESGAECELDQAGRVRIGLGYVRGVRSQEVKDLVETRERGGRFRSLADLASRAGAGSPSLELLAWSGACDSLARGPDGSVEQSTAHSRDECSAEQRTAHSRDECSAEQWPAHSRDECSAEQLSAGSARRLVLWQLGVATPGHSVPGGTQLALPLDLPAPPELRPLSRWDAMLADYATTGLTVHAHPMALLRHRLPDDAVTSTDLGRLRHGSRVRIGGLVVARQRPGTANGIVFVLLEDEFGTINLIVPPQIYERNRLTVRTEPLMFVEGRLERLPAAGGAINVMVDQVGSIAAPDRPLAEIKDFSMLDEQVRRGLIEQRRDQAREASANGAIASANGATASANGTTADHADTEADDFRAVAPAVMSFGSGRRR
jgi:error-prone DNA polymerase